MIRKLLIANRGEIARRIIRTARGMGIDTVAVFSDVDSAAPFVRDADEAVRLPGTALADTYLNAPRLVAAAQQVRADAVHPGYGFLSENAGFAEACEQGGLVFVGPPPAAIRAMGSKLESKQLMEAAGVPVLPSAEVTDTAGDTLAELGDRVGYPLLVKASLGGGGKGMRLVQSAADLAAGVTGAQREAAAAFGDDRVFLEHFLQAGRHVEVQVFADSHGRVVSLFERECSIQRRYQKIIEESPSVAVDETLRRIMSEAAVAAARSIGYVGAGTVEFMLADDGRFYFLEMNTRLQVEHPVTEAITGLDLVRLQLLVAAGEPLPPEAGTGSIDGHAIEARLYAEDPERDFLPATGTVHRFAVPQPPGVRVDSGIESGSVVSVHFDPMLAKVIAHAPTRAEAASLLAATLGRAEIHGITTNRDLLVRILRHRDFLNGATDIRFLERHPPAELGAPLVDEEELRIQALAAALGRQALRRETARVDREFPSGWRNLPSQLQSCDLDVRDRRITVRYRLERDGVLAEIDGQRFEGLTVHACRSDHVDLEVRLWRAELSVHHVGDDIYVDGPGGSTGFRLVPRFASTAPQAATGSLAAPMPGSVVRVLVEEGQEVTAGQAMIVLEAMKMEHSIVAPSAATVQAICVSVGQQVEASAALVILGQP